MLKISEEIIKIHEDIFWKISVNYFGNDEWKEVYA